MKKFGLVILAAGQGTRLKLSTPKPLAPLCGLKLIDFPLKAATSFLKTENGDVTLVLGHKKELIEEYLKLNWSKADLHFAHQKQQLGTADALRAYFSDYKNAQAYEYTVVLSADTPFVTVEEIKKLCEQLTNHDAVLASFKAQNPFGYGRIQRAAKGFSIVEEKEASAEQKKISEVNSGLYIFKTQFLYQFLNQVTSSQNTKEFYLTDLFQADRNVAAIVFDNEMTFAGINDLVQLSQVEDEMRLRICHQHMRNGVIIHKPQTVAIDETVTIAAETEIYPNCILTGATTIGSHAIIETGCVIHNSKVDADSKILAYSHLEKAHVKSQAQVGPYARLREGSVIGHKAKIGNFVETKKAILDDEVKVSHLSYVGDAEIGARTNIGCGFITCNYDGAQKHQTKIGKDSFIGSDSQMIAPITIGDGCYVASGSTINQDLDTGDFAIARTKQVTKKGMAKRFIKTSKS